MISKGKKKLTLEDILIKLRLELLGIMKDPYDLNKQLPLFIYL